MFEIGWSEFLLIGIVALIVIGPKDLPEMFRQLGRITAKLRSMARDFSRAMEDAAKESGVSDVANDLRSATRPVGTGLDGLRSAADRLEKWDPLKSPRPTLPTTTAPAASAAADAAPAAEAAAALASADASTGASTMTPVAAAAPLTAAAAMPPVAAAAPEPAAAAPAPAPAPVAAPVAEVAADETPAAPKRSPGRTRKTETPKA